MLGGVLHLTSALGLGEAKVFIGVMNWEDKFFEAVHASLGEAATGDVFRRFVGSGDFGEGGLAVFGGVSMFFVAENGSATAGDGVVSVFFVAENGSATAGDGVVVHGHPTSSARSWSL